MRDARGEAHAERRLEGVRVGGIHRKRAEAARLGEARDMRVDVIQGGVRRDGDIHAGGGKHPMVSRLRMALIALAGGRGGGIARKAEGREQARGRRNR